MSINEHSVCITGNKTVQQYFEYFYQSYTVGPNRGLFLCEKIVIPSGPHYLIINECKEYSKNKHGHMELDLRSP